MVQELLHLINSFLARRAARHNYAFSALRDGRRFVNEVREIVSLNFFLDCGKQDRFLHGRTPSSMCRGWEAQCDAADAEPKERRLRAAVMYLARDEPNYASRRAEQWENRL